LIDCVRPSIVKMSYIDIDIVSTLRCTTAPKVIVGRIKYTMLPEDGA